MPRFKYDQGWDGPVIRDEVRRDHLPPDPLAVLNRLAEEQAELRKQLLERQPEMRPRRVG